MNTVPDHLTDAHLQHLIESKEYSGPAIAAPDMLKVPAEDRVLVSSKARRLQNMFTGWNWSGAVNEIVKRYLQNPERFKENARLESERTVEVQAWERQHGMIASFYSWQGLPGSKIEGM